MLNAMSVDVEEYFHPAEVQLHIDPSTWSSLPSRALYQVEQLLDLFSEHKVSATFFILGWVAEHHPKLIRSIAARGHEIGCHSYAHQLVYSLTPAEFREDTMRAIAYIEDASGVTPISYRAPSYSITQSCLWALEILVESGFVYDSSVYPIHHDRYGIPGFNRHATIFKTSSGPIREIPIGTVQIASDVVTPIGGGAYLRLLPYRYTAAGIRRVNRVDKQPVCIYCHPWEIDPEQPRLASGVLSRLRTYTGLRTMLAKIDRLLTEFEFAPIAQVYENANFAVVDSVGVHQFAAMYAKAGC